MSHRAIRCLVGDATKSLDDKIQFGYGRFSDFNVEERTDKTWPWVWLNPLQAVTNISNDGSGSITKTWDIWIYVIDIDKSGSESKQFKKILDRMADISDALIRRVNDWYLSGTDTVGTATINSVNHRPLIKTSAEITTGWEIRFQMETSDDFDYCVDPDNTALYNGSFRNNQDTE